MRKETGTMARDIIIEGRRLVVSPLPTPPHCDCPSAPLWDKGRSVGYIYANLSREELVTIGASKDRGGAGSYGAEDWLNIEVDNGLSRESLEEILGSDLGVWFADAAVAAHDMVYAENPRGSDYCEKRREMVTRWDAGRVGEAEEILRIGIAEGDYTTYEVVDARDYMLGSSRKAVRRAIDNLGDGENGVDAWISQANEAAGKEGKVIAGDLEAVVRLITGIYPSKPDKAAA